MEKDTRFTLSLIVAIAGNGVIGREGKLPWRLGSDLRRFRQLTMGHPMIMGRRTFESIGRPLDGRDSIVLSRKGFSNIPGVYVAASPEEALSIATDCAKRRRVEEIFVIGGSKLFSDILPLATRIYLTRVHGTPEGDVRWEPQLGPDWVERSRTERERSERDEFAVTDLLLERTGA